MLINLSVDSTILKYLSINNAGTFEYFMECSSCIL